MNESSCCSTSLPAFNAVSVLDVGQSNSCPIVLICSSLKIYNAEHLLHAYHLYIFFWQGVCPDLLPSF
jgi:hypothetical protein